ncbi:hypothetical protein NTE19_003357 [Vibrio fluvialis]|nr:hypothetical protein [Vibrio fluvialis]
MADKQDYLKQQNSIAQAASAMRAVLVDSQFGPGAVFISDAAARNQAIEQAAALDPLYASMGTYGGEIAKIHAKALADHVNTTGEYPDDMLLASVRSQLENLWAKEKATSGPQLLLASVQAHVNNSAGVPTIVTTAQLTLPVALATITNDFVTYIPAKRSNEVEVYELETVAGTTLGDMTKGQVISPLAMGGQYSDMNQFYDFAAAADGVKTDYTFTSETDTPAKVKLPIAVGSAVVYINKELAAVDQGDGKIYGAFTQGGAEVLVNGTVDYDNGIIVAKCATAPAEGVTFLAEFCVDIENHPELIPEITQRATSFKIRPSQRIIRSSANIQADFKMQIELAVNARSQRLTAMRDYLAADAAISQIKKLARLCIEESSFDAGIPADSNDNWKDRYEYIRHMLSAISDQLADATEEQGLRGIYCARGLSSFFKNLPKDCFEFTPGYVQTNRPHFVGIAFGQYRIYEVPQTDTIGGYYEGIGYSKSDRLSRAPMYVGAVIPTTLYDHEVDKSLNKSDTLWTLDFAKLNPKHGQKFIHRIKLTGYEPATEEAAA